MVGLSATGRSYEQIGVVSFGWGCGNTGYPGNLQHQSECKCQSWDLLFRKEMTLVKSLHNGDPKGFKYADLQVPDYSVESTASAIRVKAIKSLLPISLHSSLRSRY
jgi:hypothetical protein